MFSVPGQFHPPDYTLYAGGRGKSIHFHMLLLICVQGGGFEREKSIPSVVPRAELMHARVQSPSPTQYTAKKETTIRAAYPHTGGPALPTLKERRA